MPHDREPGADGSSHRSSARFDGGSSAGSNRGSSAGSDEGTGASATRSGTAEAVARLSATLVDQVHRPGTPGYEEALARVFFPDAARRRPACVVAPRTVEDVSTVLATATATGASVTVRGGGLSSTCVADDAVLLDLPIHLDEAHLSDAHLSDSATGDEVVVAGGATMGTMLAVLEPVDRVVPVGIVAHAGLGLATRGGVGYLTRSLGLTVDHLVGVELVLPTGEVRRLSESSRGDDADLWWAVRGAAPYVGVVTSARLRSHAAGPVWVDRLVVGLDALAAYFRVAPELPRDTTMGAVLGWTPLSPDEPVLFVYTACASQGEAAIARARRATSSVAAASASGPLFRRESSGRYLRGLPEFAPPGNDGGEPEPIRLPRPGDGPRGSFFGKSVFTGPTLDASLADALAERIRSAPTPACRIDFQHTGGALSDVADGDTAFWGRSGEWNIPLNAIWSDGDDGAAAIGWARDTLACLAPVVSGVYSVELRPGFAETEAETARAFGGNRTRLQALRSRVDPAGVLGQLPL